MVDTCVSVQSGDNNNNLLQLHAGHQLPDRDTCHSQQQPRHVARGERDNVRLLNKVHCRVHNLLSPYNVALW